MTSIIINILLEFLDGYEQWCLSQVFKKNIKKDNQFRNLAMEEFQIHLNVAASNESSIAT